MANSNDNQYIQEATDSDRGMVCTDKITHLKGHSALVVVPQVAQYSDGDTVDR